MGNSTGKTVAPAGENMNKNVETPFFTVVVPTYNQADYLGLALDSLLGQTFDNWEAVIVNDGSTDNTKEVMEKYSAMDKRFRCFHKENGGVATALNMGIKNAHGQWICWLSSDDLFELDKLEIHHNAIIESPKIKFFHSHWYILIDETNQKIAPGLWLQIPPTAFQVTRFFWANYVHGNAIAIHKSVFDNVGLFDESLRQGQDFDMWLRISAQFPSQFINKRTCTTRIHQGQTTNTFAEGGVLDSTRALFKFLNERPFEALFPFTDLKNIKNAAIAVREIIYISCKQDAFFYRLGFSAALVEKTVGWMFKNLNQNDRLMVCQIISNIVADYLSKNFPPEIKNILRLFNQKKPVSYKQQDIVCVAESFAESLIHNGEQKKAAAIEKYLLKVTGSGETGNNKHFTPQILGYPAENGYESIQGHNVLSWYVGPGSMVTNSIKHNIQFQCPQCSKPFNIVDEYEMKSSGTEINFICPSCKKGFKLSDENFEKVFMDFHNSKVQLNESPVNSKPQIAFYIRDLLVVGGGTKIVLKHVEWLIKLGCEVTIYSASPHPDWIRINAKYIQIDGNFHISCNSYDLFVVFSIFDVPLILNHIHISKVVHLCQGYEGYHFGRDYEELRSDKHILTKLHALPVQNIAVSSHLADLFLEKFGRNAKYIPNGINHKIFRQDRKAEKEKSILFVGNPNHPLKGFQFLALAIKAIQNSPQRIENLKLNIVIGLHYDAVEDFRINLEEELNCKVCISVKLSGAEIAGLMNKSGVVVCTSWYEGFSLPLLEAMACGTPVISTRNMGAESFCIDGYNSFLVNYGDLDRICRIIMLLLEGGYDLSELIQNALHTSLEFSEFNSVNTFITAFGEMLNYSFHKDNVDKLLGEYRLTNEELIRLQKPAVSIVIPVFNQLEYTKQCIDSINNTVNEKIELIIVNNASTDGTINYLNEYKSGKIRLKIFNNNENLGFPAAVNQGILGSTGKYVVIANNDIVFTETWLERMISVAESEPEIGIVGPVSNEVSGLQKDENAKYSTIEEMHKYAGVLRERNKGIYQNFPRLAFLCTLIKRDVIDTIGGLDERFSPGNYEDDDFCLRAQLAGFKTVIAKDIFIHHYGSKSFKADGVKKYADRLEKNKNIFIDKWGATPDEIWLKNVTIKPHQYMFPLNKNEYNQMIERARINIADEEYDMALKNVEYAITLFRDEEEETYLMPLTDLLSFAGNIAIILNDNDRARVFFENELRLNPASSSACVGLGDVLMNSELTAEAKTMYEWGVKNDPSNKFALDRLVNTNRLLNLPDEDNMQLQSDFKSKSIEEVLNECFVFFEKGDWEEAIQYINQAESCMDEEYLQNNSIEDIAAFYNMKGFIYLGLKDNENARISFEKALNTNPASSQACVGLGEIFFQKGQYESAKVMFEWGIKNNEANQIALDSLEKVNNKLSKLKE